MRSKSGWEYSKYQMCQISINSENFNFASILGLGVGKYFIKVTFYIIWAINDWLYTDKFLYLEKQFENHSFRILFPMILIAWKF